ncbi:MAG: hypothetical protein IJ770_03985 [Alphaproteobacteria bacterium]|nr:hypothetical protein [Alphaproteobacteria bacterium]
MSTPEETLFKVLSHKFNAAVDEFEMNSEDDRSWHLLDSRRFEILDSGVDDALKAEAFDRVLWEIDRIHPRAHTAYCQALEQRLAYTPAKDDIALRRISEVAYRHSGGSDNKLYKKIIAGAYQKAGKKSGFPNANIAKSYLNQKEREEIEKELGKIGFYIEEGNLSTDQKLDLIEEAIELIKEPYFRKAEANEERAKLCLAAVSICREEAYYDSDAEKQYSARAVQYQKCADKARLEGAKRHGQPYKKLEEAYKKKYRTDGGR